MPIPDRDASYVPITAQRPTAAFPSFSVLMNDCHVTWVLEDQTSKSPSAQKYLVKTFNEDFKTAGRRLKEDLCNILLRARRTVFFASSDYTLSAGIPKVR